jgi:hypothetical protein
MALDKKLNNLIEVANKLDESGNFRLSDKIDHLIKTSQAVGIQTPVDYKTVRPSGNVPALGLFENLKDSSFGYQLAGGQYDAQAPGKFSGPDAVLVQKTLTPSEYAAMEKNDPEGLARLQMQEGLRAQQYLAQSGASFANLGKIISQWLGPGVSQAKKDSFKNYVLPNVFSSMVSTILSNTPVKEWDKKIKDLETTASSSSPQYALFIGGAVKESVRKTLENMKFQNAVKYQQFMRDPNFKEFTRRQNLV